MCVDDRCIKMCIVLEDMKKTGWWTWRGRGFERGSMTGYSSVISPTSTNLHHLFASHMHQQSDKGPLWKSLWRMIFSLTGWYIMLNILVQYLVIRHWPLIMSTKESQFLIFPNILKVVQGNMCVLIWAPRALGKMKAADFLHQKWNQKTNRASLVKATCSHVKAYIKQEETVISWYLPWTDHNETDNGLLKLILGRSQRT